MDTDERVILALSALYLLALVVLAGARIWRAVHGAVERSHWLAEWERKWTA